MTRKPLDPLKSPRILRLMCAATVLCLCPKHGKADTAGVVTAANTLLTTSEIQTTPFSLATGYEVSQTYSLGNAEKWTNLPGNPPTDAVRVGPVIGGGPSSYTTYELSDTVSSGQTVSPRTAALTLASTALSAYGYNTLYEIRNADDVLRAVDTTTYNYGDYRVAILGTPAAGSPFLVKFAGHHLAYNLSFNTPFVSASPMFLGTEPPDYHSIGTDLTSTQQTVVFGTDTPTAGPGGGGPGPGGPGGPGGPPTGAPTTGAVGTSDTAPTTVTPGESLVSNPFNATPTTTPYAASDVSSVLNGAAAISGATGPTYSIAAVTSADNGFYVCAATNASGVTVSNTVAVTVALQANSNLYSSTASTGTAPAPVFTTQPLNQTVAAGDSVTLTVVTDSATAYQWYKIASVHRAPLETERAAVSALATAVQADSTLAAAGKLTGTFSDVVMSVTNTGDSNFPFINTTPTYPTGTTGRGVMIGSMTAAQQATIIPLVKAMMEAWVKNASGEVANSLLADYESDAAIAQTYVGYQVGAGAADGTGVTRCNFDPTINQELVPLNSQGSYLRIDGPRAWVEMIVQSAIVFSPEGFVHYHSLYRDKLADYGNEFGGFLDTTSTDTTYTRPAFTTQPTSAVGTSATFTAVATANTAGAAVTPTYQWYYDSVAIDGATSNAYTATQAGTYYVTASTEYGTTASDAVTLTATATSHPAFFSGEASLSNSVYYLAFNDGKPFGYYTYAYFPYLYHFDAGFLYFIDAGDSYNGVYLYDFTSASFWYTSPADWPYLYDFTLNSWLYYFPSQTDATRYTSSPRYFYDFNTSAVITR